MARMALFWGIFGQIFKANGDKDGGEFLINTYTSGDQSYCNIASLLDGGFVVTWNSMNQDGSSWGIYGQK